MVLTKSNQVNIPTNFRRRISTSPYYRPTSKIPITKKTVFNSSMRKNWMVSLGSSPEPSSCHTWSDGKLFLNQCANLCFAWAPCASTSLKGFQTAPCEWACWGRNILLKWFLFVGSVSCVKYPFSRKKNCHSCPFFSLIVDCFHCWITI